MVSEINRVHIGNRRPNSVGAWRFARTTKSVCAEELCFEIPREDGMCKPHAAKARQAKKELAQ